MALIVADRVMEASTTTGTGNFTLGGAYTGYRDFDSVCANGDTVPYCIEAIDANGNPSGAWETGLGTFNDTDTLVRTTVAASSNAGAAVDFAAGNKRVMLDLTAARIAMTGAKLTDPNADRIYFWDDSEGLVAHLGLGSLLEISGTTLQPKFSGALVKKSADHTTADYSAFPNVTWNAEEYDTDTYHDNSTNPERLTVAAAGYYEVGAQVTVGNGTLTASDYTRMTISRFNSSGVQQSLIGLPRNLLVEVSTGGPSMSACGKSEPILCAAGDYFIVSFDTESDTSITVDSLSSYFGIRRVG